MATYAIGDVQGCFDELQDLLALIGFSVTRDRLWLVGDLVNRGPQSAQVLRFVKSLGDAARVVLGNHDFFLLRVAEGFGRAHPGDTLHQVIEQPDARELLDWLRHQPLVVSEGEHVMVHAGVLPHWSRAEVLNHATEIETQLRGPNWRDFLRDVFGNEPNQWRNELQGIERQRVIVNAFCRLRFCSSEGVMEFGEKRSREHAPRAMAAWYQHANRATKNTTLITGHWSTEGLRLMPNVLMLDSGCLWGGALTAVRLEDRRVFQVPSRQPLQLSPAD